ncbi:MAG: UDP-N-acetylglucosamine--N-acetylmuramyl-(pentapeptide) pyrophosphoryl-undecaprenol N-acetylglucosamine transferase [Synergistaceae bacterium]|nr:UDP-N-acetylglucosamine--N-acetylmuramyl-(pentapeptide) pyrophosphoryl-undecaprenol N-acetylglucosamine transferase [Synergistaceae bacterium]
MVKKLLLAAGGTGGHIWPAISFGQWLGKHKPDVHVDYVCGMRPLELEIYKSANIIPNRLPVDGSPFSGSGLLKRTKRAGSLFPALYNASKIIKNSSPDCCMLFGGYVSLPLLFVCRMLKIPVVMHEQNAYAGKVTRIASKLNVDIFTGWSECPPLRTGEYTRIGVPVREFERLDQDTAWRTLMLSEKMPDGPKVMVLTGSLGSQPVKKMICDVAGMEMFKDWSFVIPAVAEKNEMAADNVYLLPKTWNAGLLYSIADMAVIRAGGSTLTEVGVMDIPSVVIPWRGAADDHQYHNAVAFIAENRAIMWDGNGSAEDFSKKLLSLYSIFKGQQESSTFKRYNNAGRICEDLWLALSSHF